MLNGLFDLAGGGVLATFAIVVVIVLLVIYISRRYQVAGPNEALIIAGARGSKVRQQSGEVAALADDGIRVVVGAGAIVIPIINRPFRLSLQTYPSAINLDDGVTAQGIRVRVNATAVFKIGRQPTQIRAAAERFIGQEDQIEPTVQQVLIGSLRSIVGKLTIDALVKDRQTLIDLVFLEAKKELEPLGIDLDILNIQDITDEGFSGQESYIAQLGKQSYQTVRQNAEVATAQAEQKIIEARRAQQLTAADAKAQTDAAERKASQAGPLAEAEAAQAVTRRQTELAELEAVRREKELLASTIKTAQAEAQAAVARAQGAKSATIAGAQAEAERVRIEGQAAADAIYARGEAEAEALSLRAEAYRQFNEAAIVSAILERLPDIVRAAAEPISGIESLTVLSTDGASEVVRTATNTVAQASAVVQSLTGIDLRSAVDSAMTNVGEASKGGVTAMATEVRARRRTRAEKAAALAADEAALAESEAKQAADEEAATMAADSTPGRRRTRRRTRPMRPRRPVRPRRPTRPPRPTARRSRRRSRAAHRRPLRRHRPPPRPRAPATTQARGCDIRPIGRGARCRGDPAGPRRRAFSGWLGWRPASRASNGWATGRSATSPPRRAAPTIARQLFAALPAELQSPIGSLTIEDFIQKYGGGA